MDGIRKIQRLTWGLIFAALSGMPLAQAATISFDDDPSLSVGNAVKSKYAGFKWDPRWVVGDANSGFAGAKNNGQFLFSRGFKENLEITRANPFDFSGADFFSTSNLHFASFVISLVAYDDQNVKVGELEYSEINPDFASTPVRISVDFTNVFRLIVKAPEGGTFGMDNLELRNSAVAVNEAGGFVLLLIGLGGLWAARRRVH